MAHTALCGMINVRVTSIRKQALAGGNAKARLSGAALVSLSGSVRPPKPFIGRIAVPELVASGLTFPLTSEFGYGFTQDRPVVVHQFGELDAKAEQRFAVGIGPRKFSFRRQHLSMRDRVSLVSFWESLQGSWKSFTYNVPNPDQSLTPATVTWEYAPLSIQYLANACQVGFNFIEVPDPTNIPAYPVNSICLRFPSAALQAALLSQVQQIIPLVHIRVREKAVPDIYLSDRRCMVYGQIYQPRVLGLGEPGSDVDHLPGHQGDRR